LLASIALLLIAGQTPAAGPDAGGMEFFEKRIRPVLAEHCYKCHSAQAKKPKGGLMLDSRAGLLTGGDSGPAVVPGKATKSRLLQALRHEGDLHMPPKGKLSGAIIADFEAWITMGAPDPRDGKTSTPTATIDWDRARQFWAFQAPGKHSPPKVKDPSWPKKEIDFFVLAELEQRRLQPARQASRRALLRRATFDLTGLPPTPEEMDAFLKDESMAAFAKVVDRLLRSPHYGERWGRYWLDVARYADDQALAFTTPSPHAHRYRDWVIQAFNANMPYDEFLRLQLAGDLLPEPATDYFARLAGLGFQGLGAKYHKGSVAAQVMADEMDDRIDTLSRGLLGLTVACARCHDHKYDPIPTRDYYSLAAAYHDAVWNEIPLASPQAAARFTAWQQESKQQQAQLDQWLAERGRWIGRRAVADLGRYLRAAWRIGVLRAHHVPHDAAALARQENVQRYFVDRLLKQIEEVKGKPASLLVPWLTAARQTAAASGHGKKGDSPLDVGGLSPLFPNALTMPDNLERLTDELEREVRSAIQELDRLEGLTKAEPKKKVADPRLSLAAHQQALLKALWLEPGAAFSVSGKDAAPLLHGSERKHYDGLKADLERHNKTGPPAPLLAHAVSGGGKAMPVYLRGNVARPGELAPPGFLRILERGDTTQPPRQQFTRLDLAQAIASAKNPLTARVFVNRVWHYHFGQGIVGTLGNFGQLGDRPTHPELLDTLAVRFMESGWSVAWLHREIMLSAVYQLGSAQDATNFALDPDNHYLWRMSPRRLDVEAWRDALLAVSGRLDRTLGGPSLDLGDARNVRRTVYAKVSRYVPSTMLTLFDFPDANVTSDRRAVTTVPQQQLFVLNSEFMIEAARAFAARLAKAARSDLERIDLAFQLAYGRSPTEAERHLGLEFLCAAATAQAADRLSPWEQYAQILLATNEFAWIE